MALPAIYRRRVQHDLAAAFDWYEEQRSGLGEEFLSVVQATFKSIETCPELFAFVTREIRRAVMSRFPFAVFYVVERARDQAYQLVRESFFVIKTPASPAVARFLEFTRGSMGHAVITANGAIAVKGNKVLSLGNKSG